MSTSTHPLDILFLTNFSDHCFRVIPSIAQMADSLPVRLTLMHAYDHTCTTARSERSPRRGSPMGSEAGATTKFTGQTCRCRRTASMSGPGTTTRRQDR